jgi:hypothetical protein
LAEWVAAIEAGDGAVVDSVVAEDLADLEADRLVAVGQVEAGKPERKPWKNCLHS